MTVEPGHYRPYIEWHAENCPTALDLDGLVPVVTAPGEPSSVLETWSLDGREVVQSPAYLAPPGKFTISETRDLI